MLAGLVVTALTATLCLTASAPAQATDSWTVPNKTKITFEGRGYGHGKGMSQWSAQNAALQGVGYRDILKHAYPGTWMGQRAKTIRVLLTNDTTEDVRIEARSHLKVRANGHSRSLMDRGWIKQWRLVPVSGGRTALERLGGQWRRILTYSGDVDFYAHGRILTLHTDSGLKQYRGALRSAKGPRGRDTVNIVHLENYVRGVVPAEVPSLWKPAAVQAQAVAARTYGVYERNHDRGYYDLCDTTACQVYGGYSIEHPAATAAIKATRSQVRLYKGKPAFTQFSASNGGYSRGSSLPYQRARKDPWDLGSANPYRHWTSTVWVSRIESAYRLGNLKRIRVRRDGNGSWGGRMESVTFVGSSRTVTVSGESVRSRFGLRSTLFTFRIG